MPNWIEGTLKVKGKYENVKRFFTEGIQAYELGKNVELKKVPKDSWLEIEDYNYGEGGFGCTIYYTNGYEPHINNTHRAFITGNNVYIETYVKDAIISASIEIKQAWSFKADEWLNIAETYNLDIRLYGVESGVQFCQDVEIIGGHITKDKEITYDDWDWDCPMPRMGG